MTWDQAAAIASQVLEHLKNSTPQCMPRMDSPEQQKALVRIYADAISRFHLPEKVFPVAALKLTGVDLGGRLIGVPDFKRAVWDAHEELLRTDPEYRAECERIREDRARRKNLAMGLTPEGRSPELEARLGETPPKAIEATKARLGTLRAREARKRAGDPLQRRFGA